MSLTAAHDLMDRLALAGYRLRAQGGTLLVGGDLPESLRAEIASHKSTILEIMTESRRTRAFPCSCCGRFHFREPSVTCYWCVNDKHEQPAAGAARENSPHAPPTIAHPCSSCGGGLPPDDPDGATCWSCRQHNARKAER